MNPQGRALNILALTQNSFPRAYTKPEEDTMGREMQGGSSKTTTFPDTLPAAPPTPGVNCYFVFLLFIYFNHCTPTSQLSLPLWAQQGPAAALCVLQKRGFC